MAKFVVARPARVCQQGVGSWQAKHDVWEGEEPVAGADPEERDA